MTYNYIILSHHAVTVYLLCGTMHYASTVSTHHTNKLCWHNRQEPTSSTLLGTNDTLLHKSLKGKL